jgi:hypothetical protein
MTLSSRSASCLALISLCFVSPACSIFKSGQSQTREDIIAATRFWQPHLLYLLKSPHPRLHVEVDAVAGSEPDEAKLDKLREFLAAYCQKPGGIDIVRDDVIPVREARGLPHMTLSRRYIDGPPPHSAGSPPAFLYLLYYDGALCDQTPQPRPSDQRERNANPQVDYLPYPAAIYINTRYGRLWDKQLGAELTLHEAGHLLGLSRRTAGASGHHCLDSHCLMHAQLAFHLNRWLLGRDPISQHRICKDCAAELAGNAKRTPARNLRFVGPVLVRSEAGYQVLSLVGHLKLVVGPPTDQACRDFAAEVRAKAWTPEDQIYHTHYFGEMDRPPLSSATRNALKRAQSDPYDKVRELATELEKATVPTP